VLLLSSKLQIHHDECHPIHSQSATFGRLIH
jgi:hypothetical protein